MGRWRPPSPESSPYITPDGYQALQDELKALWIRRTDVVKALSAAAAEGDRSENAEYIYRKKELGGIDYRIRYLQKRLPKLNVVQNSPTREQVFFGARVSMQRDNGSRVEYRIVGADEADAKQNCISIDSPMARALLKKQVKDKIELTIEEHCEHFVIESIRYD
jgi:transcription elongation factor GreB